MPDLLASARTEHAESGDYGEDEHGDDAESDVRDFPRWLDALFSAALAIERTVIGWGLSLPFGGSLLIVARRDD